MSAMDERIAGIVATLRGVEEELAELGYEALAARIDGDDGAAGRERQVLRARRAVERAINALERSGDR